MKKLMLLTSLVISSTVIASPAVPLEQQISSITTEEVSSEELNSLGLSSSNSNKGMTGGIPGGMKPGNGIPGGFTGIAGGVPSGSGGGRPAPDTNDPFPGGGTGGIPGGYGGGYPGGYGGGYPGGYGGGNDPIGTAGQVITVARDMVALGEAVYDLVRRGKPSNVTEYAPISVVPRDPMTKEYMDPFELEGFSMPVERNYVTKIKNGVGKVVVTFAYKVMYSYGGSYNGTGKFLTNVIIIPSSVVTKFGWEFNATMKPAGIFNHGSRANPVAGVLMTIKYQMNGWRTAHERNDTIHITGRGQLKNHSVK